MDFEDLEATILKGFVRDRQLITIALNQGFSPELLPSPVARHLVDYLYLARGGEVINEVTVRTHLETQGVLNAEMEHYLRAVLAMRPPDAGKMMTYVDSLRNRDSRDRLQALHEQLTSFLGGGEGSQGDLIQFTTEM